MTDAYSISPIGRCRVIEGRFEIHVAPEYRDGLIGLSGFSHAIALWWAHEADSAEDRARLSIPSPYTTVSVDAGVFSTRSEARPNPIGLSVFTIASVDPDIGRVTSPYFDMHADTPILDVKPYFPASDHVEDADIPKHFSHWPRSFEASAEFDWSKEFRA